MDKTNQSSPSQEANEAIRVIEARLSALEQRIAGQSENFVAAELDESALGRDELSAELERHRDQLRDYEKALVERIADVDDDRRATASKLQRAWQTQREEIDERLRRFAGIILGMLALFAVLVAIALFLIYRQAPTGQSNVAGQVAEIRQELTQLSGKGAVGTQVREKLERLTGQVGAIASSVERLNQRPELDASQPIAAERAAREKSEADLGKEIRRLDAEQKRFAQEVASLRSVADGVKTDLSQRPPVEDAATEKNDEAVGTDDSTPVMDSEDVAPAGGTAPEPSASLNGAAEDQGREERSAAVPEHVVKGDEAGARPGEEGSDSGATDSERTLVAGGDIYALQLIGYFSEKSVDEFVARKGLPTQVYVDQQTYQGRPWYVVIHSLHDDYAAAEEALAELPANLSKLRPMIRPLSDVTALKIIKTGQRPE